MSDIVHFIKTEEDSVYSEKGVSDSDIKKAEHKLGMKFADEFRRYLKEIGTAAVNGHQLTGISKDENLDVIHITKIERERNTDIENLYVVERTDVDGIIIWQSEFGEVYQAMPKGKPVKICNSLKEYLED